LRAGAGDDELLDIIRDAVWHKDRGYAARQGPVERPITMHAMGG
jgi:cyclic pyranopterin phosphate synthase